VSALADGGIAAATAVGFVVVGRILYRMSRTVTTLRERVARLEGGHHHREDDTE
jgi:hypothetical protein